MKLFEKVNINNGIKKGLKEVKLIRRRVLKGMTFDQFLKELNKKK